MTSVSQQILAFIYRWGYLGVGVIIGGESMGLPLPGETAILVAAGLAKAGHFNPWLVWAAAATGAIVGDNIGYSIGRFGGHPLIARWGGWVGITPERLARAQEPVRRYGWLAVFFGRFVAILRAVTALVAGIAEMPWPEFLAANAAGGIVWSGLVTAAGYFGEGLAKRALLAVEGWPRLYQIAAFVLLVALVVAGFAAHYRITHPRPNNVD